MSGKKKGDEKEPKISNLSIQHVTPSLFTHRTGQEKRAERVQGPKETLESRYEAVFCVPVCLRERILKLLKEKK